MRLVLSATRKLYGASYLSAAAPLPTGRQATTPAWRQVAGATCADRSVCRNAARRLARNRIANAVEGPRKAGLRGGRTVPADAPPMAGPS